MFRDKPISMRFACNCTVWALYAWCMTCPRNILAIESSCDETAAAVLQDGEHLLSSIVASQIAVHREFGGIVPELASRHHMEAIEPVVREALQEAGMTMVDINGVAVTRGPGLVGSLIVGFSFAKALSAALDIPFTGVDHVYAHLYAVFLEGSKPQFPYIGLVVSGGHTSLYVVEDFHHARVLGQTRDDAAGEAFDKVAKILGLEYPGGPVISRLADRGRPGAFSFPRSRLRETPLDFSFSGLKTAVLTQVRKLETAGRLPMEDVCASFQEAVVDVLVEKTMAAARMEGISTVVLSGGVAANRRLRDAMKKAGDAEGIRVLCPSMELCTDNAAMVALTGYHRLCAGMHGDYSEDVYSRMPIFRKGRIKPLGQG